MKNVKKYLLLVYAAIFIVLFTGGCSGDSNVESGGISEGIIVFDATPLDPEHPFASYAPSKMTVKFKNNRYSAYMSAGMGALTASFISDNEKQTFTQVVRLFTDNYVVILNKDDLKKENEKFDFEIKPTNETKMIAGYKCKKAIVNVKGEEPVQYDIYYTNEIDIKNSNFSNPYYKLDGVLMEYRMKKFDLEMQFTATSVTKEAVDDAIFEVPDQCEQISQEVLEEKLKAYQ
ncbi:MAG: hypothetical protein WAQ28_06990 [Bacteroidia bacterium]|jgi:GLPGLI family protein